MTRTRRLCCLAISLAAAAAAPALGADREGPASVERSGPACDTSIAPPVDVAGHLTIAARTDLRPLDAVWRWGAVPVGIAVGRDGSVTWTQYRTGTIERIDANGDHRETVATVEGPLGLAVDPENDRIFYAADRLYPRSIGRLRPGGKPEPLVCGSRVNRPFAIALAGRGTKLYWTESINGRIRSAATDGTQVESFFDDGINSTNEIAGVIAQSPAAIAIDEERGFLYWSDLRNAAIVRASVDSSEREVILGRNHGLELPTALAVDLVAAKLYWADPGRETISRADLDGLHPEVVVGADDGLLEPYGLAVDRERRLLYWTDIARNGLFRRPLAGGPVERFIDLDPDDSSAPPEEAGDTCVAVTKRVRVEFLRRWLKSVRTCVVAVTATKAVMRVPADLAPATGVCTRQLGRAHDLMSLRSDLEAQCSHERAQAAFEAILRLGAEIVAADLPRAAWLLRDIRPFVAKQGPPAEPALAAIDGLLERQARLDSARTATIDSTLPATGQTTTYAATTRQAGRTVATADDGALRTGSSAAFVDNGDGTISDRNTGLTWEKKCSDCGGLHDFETRYRWTTPDGKADVAAWLREINSEGGTGFAGHHDWRVPEISELLGIIDYERFNPAVGLPFDGDDCGLGCDSLDSPRCSCTYLGPYWAVPDLHGRDDEVPVVVFNLGLVWGQSATSDAYIRAVRGPRPEQHTRLIDNGDGTVTDAVTRLMWEKKRERPGDLHDVARHVFWSFDGATETIWDWLAAVNTESGSGLAGHDDWRIPNVKELYSLFDAQVRRTTGAPPAGGTGGDTPERSAADDGTPLYRGLHWTSTTFADFPSLAVTVGFETPDNDAERPPGWPDIIRIKGGVEPHEKTLPLSIRAVRGPVPATR